MCHARGAFVERDGPHERVELADFQLGTQSPLELGGGLVVFRIGGVVVVVFGVVVMVVMVVVVGGGSGGVVLW